MCDWHTGHFIAWLKTVEKCPEIGVEITSDNRGSEQAQILCHDVRELLGQRWIDFGDFLAVVQLLVVSFDALGHLGEGNVRPRIAFCTEYRDSGILVV
jgi:hypothetical protein